jgi:hypothetical protein
MLEEVRSVEVRLVEVRKNERLLRPPLIPDLDALDEGVRDALGWPLALARIQ